MDIILIKNELVVTLLRDGAHVLKKGGYYLFLRTCD